ncbi:hypothetical protein BJV77DRAFT_1161896 [Russula vinacea]|nr:hypothetical protein BJV77DRAFT_1161896 [Russula vinacea]
MSHLPTWWYNCPHFWMVHDSRTEALLSHAGVLLVSPTYRPRLRLEKPRKDFKELVAHHIVTYGSLGLPLVLRTLLFVYYTTVPRWSYGINLTLIGNAVYASMDIPDFFFGMSKLFNYLRWKRTQNIMFIVFVGVWTYFRHYLNLVMLYSVYKDFDLIPQSARSFEPERASGWCGG